MLLAASLAVSSPGISSPVDGGSSLDGGEKRTGLDGGWETQRDLLGP